VLGELRAQGREGGRNGNARAGEKAAETDV